MPENLFPSGVIQMLPMYRQAKEKWGERQRPLYAAQALGLNATSAEDAFASTRYKINV